MDELEEIKKKKMEKMMSEINKPHEPTIEQPGKPIIITDATVDAASNQYPLLILDCWAEWCGPCRMIAPVLQQLAKDYKDKLKVAKINVDQEPDLAARYGIQSIPTLLFFKGGQMVKQQIGAVPRPALEKIVKELV